MFVLRSTRGHEAVLDWGLKAEASTTIDPEFLYISPCPKSFPIGADHAGFALKERLKQELQALGYEPLDLGTHSVDSTDYPD